MSISAKELSQILGISPATVSMVFNNKPGISTATREMVFKAAEQYGYKNSKKNIDTAMPSSIIQFVTYKKHGQVVANTPFFSELTEGITQECYRQNCVLHMSYVQEKYDMKDQIQGLKEINCVGILLLATEMNEEDFKWFSDFKVPIVVLDCYYNSLDYDCVVINNLKGAYTATNYLIDTGHQNIGYLRSNISISNFSERADGYYKALRAHNMPSDHPYMHRITPSSQEGYLDMLEILKGNPPIADAYFADNDIIAAAAMKAFYEYGYRIPEDVSIIGFDDMPLCDIMVPALSTMRVRKKALGAAAVYRLIERIHDNSPETYKIAMSTELAIRDSISIL